jgi:DtxR family transcriptional regulator, Mn-dependent transcriptional regulator
VKNSYTEENYLKAIYKLQEKTGAEVSTNDISKEMSTKAASVTDMLKRLSEKTLINYQKYQGVSLTEMGRKVALAIVRKHRLWETFLVNKLKFKWDEVHDIAEQLEHVQSEELIEKLNEYLDYPQYDPHGDPIPSKKGVFANKRMEILYEMPIGFTGNVSGVSEHSASFLKHLEKIGIGLGVSLKIEDKNEYDNSVWVRIEMQEPVFISKEVAKNLLVFNK